MLTNTQSLTPANVVEFLGSIFDRRGGEEYLGEPVTMGEHMLQAAAIAAQDNQPDDIVVAALLHDIGHFTSEFGTFSMADTSDRFHEQAGAEVLEQFFPSVITDCVRFHVAAKRYLCATSPAYFSKLSKASVHSLNLQGGVMNADEIAQFENNPNLEKIIAVRYLDDAAKDPYRSTPDYWHYAPLVQRMVDQHIAS